MLRTDVACWRLVESLKAAKGEEVVSVERYVVRRLWLEPCAIAGQRVPCPALVGGRQPIPVRARAIGRHRFR